MKLRFRPAAVLPILLGCACPMPALAGEPEPAAKTVALEYNARLRNEHVDDDAFAQAASATTLRLRMGVRVTLGRDWNAGLEGEAVGALNDHYNSGANGQVLYPSITDPTGVELNQAWLGWHHSDFSARLGRQRVTLDNQRWISNAAWRQNEQTFDAATFEWKPRQSLTARYYWLDRVHRVNGREAIDPLARERDLDTHAVDIAFNLHGHGLGVYAYAHEDRDVPSASTLTTGMRWSGRRVMGDAAWGWRAEWARQRDHAGNPLAFRHDYALLEPSVEWRGVKWRLGWERLGGNGTHALQTPLAALHAFNGWADKFVVTPPAGLRDRYVAVDGSWSGGQSKRKLVWALAWHDYRADATDRTYGSEWGGSFGFPIGQKLSGLLKFSEYRSDGFAKDTSKVWLQVEWAK